MTRSTVSYFGVPRTCPYCGVPIKGRAIVCADHSDLPSRDPGFTNRRVTQAPIGVQVFAATSQVSR